MEPGSLDLDAYFARIGHRGGAAPTLANLAALHAAHVAAIPFENLSPLLGEPVPLDLPALEDKLVRRQRGGWCFEHNLLFAHALRAIGFRVTMLAARVRWNVPPNVVTPRSHCLLRVDAGGEPLIADVGFGGLTLTAPLRFETGIEQATLHERHRLVEEGGGYALEAKLGGEWQRLYEFELHEQLQADYEVSNWYLANHPSSQFVSGLICARADAERRHALRGTRYSIYHADGRTERRMVADASELRSLLEVEFRIPLPPGPKLDAALAKIVANIAPPVGKT